MKIQEAIKILMLSPCYWRLSPKDRKELVREFCASYDSLSFPQTSKISKK